MGLREYKRKRDFNRTPEPDADETRKSSSGFRYLIQKHAASRLHYDFRLEHEGVLWSWAVTKGPSLDPKDKRLAVRTEDHPIGYGSFEGVIPKGQYGGGTVMLWDTGTWQPLGAAAAAMRKGHLSFSLAGKRLQGRWDLIRMKGEGKGENWLLIKFNDEAARAGDIDALLKENLRSAASGRSMDEIADGKEQPARKTRTRVARAH